MCVRSGSLHNVQECFSASYTVCLCWFYVLVHTVVICKVGLALEFHAHSFLASLL